MPKEIWLKKRVSRAEYKSYYSHNPFYTYLESDGSGVMIGFLSVEGSFRGDNVDLLNNDKMKRLDEYRRNANIRPFVFWGKDDDIKITTLVRPIKKQIELTQKQKKWVKSRKGIELCRKLVKSWLANKITTNNMMSSFNYWLRLEADERKRIINKI